MKNKFPNVQPVNFIPKKLAIWGWHFPKNRIGEKIIINGKDIKKLLTLDINISDSKFASIVNSSSLSDVKKVFAKNYPCPHSCPGCFNNTVVKNTIMTYAEVVNIIDQGLKLGLESIKFLGPGELLANPNLFQILDDLQKRNIIVGIFTKGAIMGSDVLSQMYHGINSQEFVNKLTNYNNITFLVGSRSFDSEIENKYIPTKTPKLRDAFNYHESRNIAIERLCQAGMNSDQEKQRLAIITSPVGPETIDGVSEIFKWGCDRNIPVLITTTMVSGKGHKLVKSHQGLEFERKYKDLAVEIYLFLINKEAKTIDELKQEKVSPYVGIAPCNQLTHGLYIHYDGEVWRCPGNDTARFVVHGNIRNSSLLDIWLGSKNYKINKFNNGCVKDEISIPKDFYQTVLRRLI
ncbi:hypothetical protein A2995_01060 [Candidatus Nomurabacteria bacterium RIFCSPLOWO2_01_FULL_33_24]|uniref:4Fe4S-binding SPASM domain-containing protein n=1 Tax=Candidatus Nomurabacteria bacterium RIFCSPLOWO2_01_FULL_33_24 TaxID=1801765 RepID=A0A1F6WZG2_9BACT|nr:MAG: hypothetical protein A2995_01060 [Candidatus Nomurabacteria bacterium RIFCSPLOWO2_01_FULL_33_24]